MSWLAINIINDLKEKKNVSADITDIMIYTISPVPSMFYLFIVLLWPITIQYVGKKA